MRIPFTEEKNEARKCRGPHEMLYRLSSFHFHHFSERRDSPTSSKGDRDPGKGGAVGLGLVGGNGREPSVKALEAEQAWLPLLLASSAWVTSLASDPQFPRRKEVWRHRFGGR